MNYREILMDLIIDAKRTDPETGSFSDFLVDYLIANGVVINKWIPVSEKAPKAPCLIFDANKNVPSAADGIITITDEKHGTWFCDIKLHYWTQGKDKFVSYGNRITHWMPLPEPPK